MSIPIIVLGKSGTGKTMSYRNFGEGQLSVVNIIGKLLPFFDEPFAVVDVPSWQGKVEEQKGVRPLALDAVVNYLKGDTPPAVVVDDFGYCITEMYMRWQDEPKYQKNKFQIYTDIASKVYNAFMNVMTDGNVDRVVYWIMHEDQTVDDGVVPMTVGKLLNEKVNLLGMCTITLRSMFDGENGYVFEVSGANGKTPPNMFEGSSIEKFGDYKVENDLKEIDAAIRRKYRKPPNDGKKPAKATNSKEQ